MKFKHFRQSAGLCGPASLKILYSNFGKDFSEQELAMLCHATAKHGTDHQDMVNAVTALGDKAITKENATLHDLRSAINNGHPVIVGWWSTDDDHYSVVFDMNETSVYMMDPELDDGIRIMPTVEFERVWHDFDGPDNKKIERWMMVVEHKTPLT